MNTLEDIRFWADYWYNKIGINIIPADTRNKKTWIKWSEYQENPISKEQINAWMSDNSFKNGLAVISGKIWRGEHAGKYLIFIDCDNQLGIDEICKSVGAKDINQISTKWLVEQHSGSPTKAHIYVISPIPFPKKSSDSPDPIVFKAVADGQMPAIEIKGEGKHGIAYATPSPHHDGTDYSIIGTKEPVPLRDEEARELLSKLNAICVKYGIKYLEGGTTVSQRTPIEDLFNADFKIYAGNNRHEAVLRVAESLIRRNRKIMSPDKIKSLVSEWNVEHCVPPLPQSDIESQWKHAVRFIDKKLDDENEEDTIDDGNPFNRKDASKLEKIEYAVDKITSQHAIKTIEDTKEMFSYKDGIYEPYADNRIHEILGDLAGPSLEITMKNQIIDYIRSKTYVKKTAFDADKDWIHVMNGWLNIHTKEFLEDSPDRLSFAKIPVTYDPKARCPRIIKFLKEVLEPEDIKEMVKFFGYLLFKEYKFHKFFILVGDGGNGKGTLIRLMERFVGEKNIVTVSPHDFSENRFAKARLLGKLLNACGDVSSKPIDDTDVLKGLTGQDLINAEVKYKDGFDFRNYAKVLFSANKIPKSADESYGFWRRVIVIPFNRTFEGPTMDGDLDSKLQTDAELSGLLNLALWGLKVLLDENGFNTKSISEMKKMYEISSTKADSFLQEMCVLGADFSVESDKVMNAFEKYCKEKGSSYIAKKELGEAIAKIDLVEHKQKTIKGKGRVYHYFGMTLKEELDQQQATL